MFTRQFSIPQKKEKLLFYSNKEKRKISLKIYSNGLIKLSSPSSFPTKKTIGKIPPAYNYRSSLTSKI